MKQILITAGLLYFKKEIIDHEIMHCSCSVQSLIPGGTDTEHYNRSKHRDFLRYTPLPLHRPVNAAR